MPHTREIFQGSSTTVANQIARHKNGLLMEGSVSAYLPLKGFSVARKLLLITSWKDLGESFFATLTILAPNHKCVTVERPIVKE